jgi:amino acid adenylation domain-containing protein
MCRAAATSLTMPFVLQQYLAQQADRRPESTALVDGATRAAYGDLESASNRLARLLRDSGCRKGDRICWFGPKSLAAVISLLGIYKADCIYVPIDPASPSGRIAKILQACRPRWILAAGRVDEQLDHLFSLEGVPTVPVGWMDARRDDGRFFAARFRLHDLEAVPDEPVAWTNAGPEPAYLLFTSGSTGMPKGVIVSHRSVIEFVSWASRYFDMRSSDHNSCHSPLHFDLSVFDLFGTFATGAELHLVPPGLSTLPARLSAFIRDAELTQWFSVPSVLSYMATFDAVQPGDFPALRRLIWCGEVLPTPVLQYWMKRLPHVRFTNLYGPTETTIASSYYTVPACPSDPLTPIPIGMPCGGEGLAVLDTNLRPVPSGTIGELCIRGNGLALGYWHDPEATRAAFLPDPERPEPGARIYRTGDLAWQNADGLTYFVGRTDMQVKSRGHRIELGEVEAALATVPLLREAVIVALPTGEFDGVALCCAYVPRANVTVSPARLRTALHASLPSYMLPSQWLELDALPRNANGKVDRRRLLEEFRHRAAQAS